MVEKLEELLDVSREQVESAGGELANAAVRVLGAGLKTPEREVSMKFLRLLYFCFPQCGC